jgi:hypothetical protein
VTYAAEDSSIFQRKDSLHRNSEEWILKILSPQVAGRKTAAVDKGVGNGKNYALYSS